MTNDDDCDICGGFGDYAIFDQRGNERRSRPLLPRRALAGREPVARACLISI